MLKEKDDLERIFNEQLEKCGVDFFDYYLLHCLNGKNYKKAEKLGVFDYLQKKKAEGKEELKEAPYLEKEDLSEDVPYAPMLVRRALPYWLAYRFLMDDDQDARAQLYYNEYVNALGEAQKMTPGEVEDVYA